MHFFNVFFTLRNSLKGTQSENFGTFYEFFCLNFQKKKYYQRHSFWWFYHRIHWVWFISEAIISLKNQKYQTLWYRCEMWLCVIYIWFVFQELSSCFLFILHLIYLFTYSFIYLFLNRLDMLDFKWQFLFRKNYITQFQRNHEKKTEEKIILSGAYISVHCVKHRSLT